MTQIDFLIDTIKDFDFGDPIYTRVLSAKISIQFGLDQKKADTATAVSIKRVLERNLLPELRCYQKGIYYRAKKTPFGFTPINSDTLIFDKYIANDNGYESGLGEMHVLGLVSQMPRQRTVVSNAAYDCTRTDSKYDVVVRPPKTEINSENKIYLQLLDAIEQIDKAPVDTDNPFRKIYRHIEDRKINYIKLLSYAHKYYGKDVVLKLGQIASEGEKT